jgi:MFS family permease
VLVGSSMAVLDTTIVNVALPSIGRGAHASSGALEWVVSGYALTFGLALVPVGKACRTRPKAAATGAGRRARRAGPRRRELPRQKARRGSASVRGSCESGWGQGP